MRTIGNARKDRTQSVRKAPATADHTDLHRLAVSAGLAETTLRTAVTISRASRAACSPLGTGRPKRSGGGLLRIILIIAIVLFLMNMLGMCGTSSSSSQGGSGITVTTPVPTAAPTANTNANAGTQSSSASIGHWNPPTTTYEDTNLSNVSTEVSGGAREKFTKLLGNGNDQVTVLIYMCGTDLETNYGMATSDLNEMLYATHSDKVNIVVETGGTRRWKNSVMANTTNQRWLIADRSVVALDKNVGKKAMTDPATAGTQMCRIDHRSSFRKAVRYRCSTGRPAGSL